MTKSRTDTPWSGEVYIRPATIGDINSLVELSDQLEQAASSRPYTPRDIAKRLPRILDALESNTTSILIAELGNAAVGYVSAMTFSNFKGRIEGKATEIVVQDQLRRRGIGTRLFRATIHHFEAMGVEVFEVTTATDNHAAQKFYEKQGLTSDEIAFRGRI